MPRRDYRRNQKTDLLAAVALIVGCVALTAIVVITLLSINSLFF